MFGMFKDMGQLAGLMKQLPRIKEEMERRQKRVGQLGAEGDAGGGMVHVRVNGKMEMLACKISEDAMKTGDRELLEDLITSAVNQALQKIRQLINAETTKMAGDLGLPAGFNVPGILREVAWAYLL